MPRPRPIHARGQTVPTHPVLVRGVEHVCGGIAPRVDLVAAAPHEEIAPASRSNVEAARHWRSPNGRDLHPLERRAGETLRRPQDPQVVQSMPMQLTPPLSIALHIGTVPCKQHARENASQDKRRVSEKSRKSLGKVSKEKSLGKVSKEKSLGKVSVRLVGGLYKKTDKSATCARGLAVRKPTSPRKSIR